MLSILKLIPSFPLSPAGVPALSVATSLREYSPLSNGLPSLSYVYFLSLTLSSSLVMSSFDEAVAESLLRVSCRLPSPLSLSFTSMYSFTSSWLYHFLVSPSVKSFVSEPVIVVSPDLNTGSSNFGGLFSIVHIPTLSLITSSSFMFPAKSLTLSFIFDAITSGSISKLNIFCPG